MNITRKAQMEYKVKMAEIKKDYRPEKPVRIGIVVEERKTMPKAFAKPFKAHYQESTMDLNTYDLENLDWIAYCTFCDDELGAEVTPEAIQYVIDNA